MPDKYLFDIEISRLDEFVNLELSSRRRGIQACMGTAMQVFTRENAAADPIGYFNLVAEYLEPREASLGVTNQYIGEHCIDYVMSKLKVSNAQIENSIRTQKPSQTPIVGGFAAYARIGTEFGEITHVAIVEQNNIVAAPWGILEYTNPSVLINVPLLRHMYLDVLPRIGTKIGFFDSPQ
jgi:hypothetical protein